MKIFKSFLVVCAAVVVCVVAGSRAQDSGAQPNKSRAAVDQKLKELQSSATNSPAQPAAALPAPKQASVSKPVAAPTKAVPGAPEFSEVPPPTPRLKVALPAGQPAGAGALAGRFSEVPAATPGLKTPLPAKPSLFSEVPAATPAYVTPLPAKPSLFSDVPPATPAYTTPLPPLERMVAEAKARELEKRLEAEHAQAEKDRQAQAKANAEKESRAEARARAQKGPQAVAKAQPEKAPQTAAKAQPEKAPQTAAKAQPEKGPQTAANAKAERDRQTAAQARAENERGHRRAERVPVVMAKTSADEAKAKPNTPPGAETRPLAMMKGPLVFPPIEPPPLPISMAKQQRLAELLRKYKADDITPAQYHEERARILAEPESPAQASAKP
jgi:hypothetical protein